MRLNFFSRASSPEPQDASPVPSTSLAPTPTPLSGKTFPADEIVWGIVIRNGFDELDDPWYHRGTTQHAYLEGNDNVAICGFRPPQSGPRTRRRSRLGLPTGGEHPMCGMCARLVVAPRPRVPVPVQGRPPVAVPVARPAQPVPVASPVPGVAPAPAAQPLAAAAPPAPVPMAPPAPVPMAPPAPVPMAPPAAPTNGTPTNGTPTSPWVRQRAGIDEGAPDLDMTVELGSRHDGGLIKRGVHTDIDED